METLTEIHPLIKLAEARKTNELLKRRQALKQGFGIHFYRPHAKQDKFHIAANATGRYCRTGNRGGKTKCGAAEDISQCLGYRPFYEYEFDVLGIDYSTGKRLPYVARHHPGGEEHPYLTVGIAPHPIKLLLIVADWDKAQEIFTNNLGSYENLGELFQLIPSEAVAHVNKSRGGHVDRVDIKRPAKYGGGISSIYLDTIESFKHAKLSAESSDFDRIHVDEPCPRNMFVAHKRGLVDRDGKFWINCTPIDEMWINDEFSPPKQHVVKEAPTGLAFNKLADGGGSRFIITWSMKDNPYNRDSAIAEFEAGLTREEKECRISGIPLAMAGLVYKEFIHDVHTLCDVPKGWEAYDKPPANYTIRFWFDFHTRLPQAVLFFATAPDGTIFVFDELFDDNLIDLVARQILRRKAGRFVADQEIDPFALIPHPVYETTICDELEKYGLFFSPASKDKSLGINKVREKLAERHPISKLPTIFFSPNLQETLYEFSHYVFDIKKNEPKDENDHMMENLYRAILNGLPYIEPPTDEDYSQQPFEIRDTLDDFLDHVPV